MQDGGIPDTDTDILILIPGANIRYQISVSNECEMRGCHVRCQKSECQMSDVSATTVKDALATYTIYWKY